MPSNYLYAVIAVLNNRAHIQALLTSFAQQPIEIRPIVIDNGSEPETLDWLLDTARRSQGGLIVVSNELNAGVAAAWNLGIRIALANQAQAMLVLGSDTVPMPGAIPRMVELIRAGALFVTGTTVPYTEPERPCPPAEQVDTVVLAPDFSCFLLPSITIELLGRFEGETGAKISPWELGLFDTRFSPAYFEDNDYHTRLHRAGIVAVRDTKALFRHDCSLTIRTNPEIAAQNQQTFQQNLQRFIEKWGSAPHQLDTPPQARPLNVTDEQWLTMTGGRLVEEVDLAAVRAQAEQVYGRYRVASPPAGV